MVGVRDRFPFKKVLRLSGEYRPDIEGTIYHHIGVREGYDVGEDFDFEVIFDDYPNIDTPAVLKTAEAFKSIYDGIADAIDRKAAGEPIWREVCVKDPIKYEEELFNLGKTTNKALGGKSRLGVGVYWSWDEESAKSYNVTDPAEFSKCVRIAAKINGLDDINIQETFAVNFVAEMEEREIRIKPNRKIELLQICVKNGGYADKGCKTKRAYADKVKVKGGSFFDGDHEIIT